MRDLKLNRWVEYVLVLAPLSGFWWLAMANAQSEARNGMMLGGLIGLLLTAVATWFITHRTQGDFARPVAAAKKMVAGDLTAKIELDGSGEVRELMEAIQALNERMLKLVSDVRTRSTTVAGTSSQVSRDNETLRVRSEMQVASLQQTASAMAQLNDIVERSAAQAKQADDLVSASSKHALEGGKAMSQVVTTMRSIRESSKKIVDIIGLIDSIAFQTNILALNAAVEAARAGEHGRGFAVVATEVGTLAKRSATAAKEIKTLIGESVNTIATGGKLVDDAGVTIASIVSSVQSLTTLIQGISHASVEQRSGIDTVNSTVKEVLRLNKSNTHMFADIIKASATMNEQSVTLLKSIAGFNLGIREYGTPDEAHAMVKRGIEFLKAHGKEQFLAEVNKRDEGRFIERDLYLMVCDVASYKFIAHGVNNRIQNYDSRLSKDPSGRSYMTEMIDNARKNGECWIDYSANHPMTNELMNKRSFAQRVDDMVVACGAYLVGT